MRMHRRAITPLRRLVVVVGAAAMGVTACGSHGVQPGDALWFSGGIGNGLSMVHVGEPVFLGMSPLRANPGTHLIHLLRVDVLGVPDGLVIDHVWAERFSIHGGTGLGEDRGFDAPARERINLHEVDTVMLDPMCGPAAKCLQHPGQPYPPTQDWYLAIQAHISRPGAFGPTRDLRIVYEVDGQQYEQTVHDRISLSSGGVDTLPKT